MPFPFSLEFPPTLKQSTPSEKLLFSSPSPCSWPIPPTSSRAEAFKSLQTGSPARLTADSAATGGGGRAQVSWPYYLTAAFLHGVACAASPLTSHTPLTLLMQTHVSPRKSYSYCERKHGDVRKRGVCSHPATFALPPRAGTAMAPSLITRQVSLSRIPCLIQ